MPDQLDEFKQKEAILSEERNQTILDVKYYTLLCLLASNFTEPILQ